MKTVEFKGIYYFEAFNNLKEGKKVSVCDRQIQSCDTLNEMTVDEAIALINDAEEHKDRYNFWIEEETEKNRK